MPGTRSSQTEQRILATAADLLAQRGIGAASMRAIAERAGITAGAIYRHFPDKRTLVDQVVHEAFRDLEVRLLKAIRSLPAGSFARVVALGEAYLQFAQENPEAFRLLFDPFGPKLRKVREFPGEVFSTLRQCVVEAMDSGEMRRADPDLVTFFLWSRVHGVFMLLMACDFTDELSSPDGDLSPLSLFNQTREFLGTGLLAQPASELP